MLISAHSEFTNVIATPAAYELIWTQRSASGISNFRSSEGGRIPVSIESADGHRRQTPTRPPSDASPRRARHRLVRPAPPDPRPATDGDQPPRRHHPAGNDEVRHR